MLSIIAAIPAEIWGALAGAVLTAIFSFWRGSNADRARGLVVTLAEGAWYVAERSGGSGAEKFAKALESFRNALEGQGLRSAPKAEALAQSIWEGMSAAGGTVDPPSALVVR